MKSICLYVLSAISFILAVSFVIAVFSGQARAAETLDDALVDDLYQCKIQKVLLVDEEECQFLGKVIGTPYHCMNKTDKGLLFWNLGREDLAVLIDPQDPHFTWFKDQN